MGQNTSRVPRDEFFTTYYTPKQITKEKIEELFIKQESKCTRFKTSLEHLGSEKIAVKCNEVLKSLKLFEGKYEFQCSAEVDGIDPEVCIAIFNDIFKAKAFNNGEKCMLSKTDGLRLIFPCHQRDLQCSDIENANIQHIINIRHFDQNNQTSAAGEKKSFGVVASLQDDLEEAPYCNSKEEIDAFFQFLVNRQLDGLDLFALLTLLRLVINCNNLLRGGNGHDIIVFTKFQLLDAIYSQVNETNFLGLCSDKTGDPAVKALLHWCMAQYSSEKFDLTPHPLSVLFLGYLKFKEFKIEEPGVMEGLLKEMGNKMEPGPVSTDICKTALKTEDHDLKNLLDSFFITLQDPEERNEHYNKLSEVYSAEFSIPKINISQDL
jgi:hypothetical protein